MDKEVDRRASDAERLRESLGELPNPVLKPALVVVSGLPGTGKSYFCRQLLERMPFALLETDALRKALFPQPTHSAEESGRLFPACHRLIAQLLKRGIRVLFDATNLSRHHREYLYNVAEQADAKLVIVRVEAPEEVVQERLRRRAEQRDTEDRSDADMHVYRRMRRSVDPIRRNHFAVDTSGDIMPVVNKVLREVRK